MIKRKPEIEGDGEMKKQFEFTPMTKKYIEYAINKCAHSLAEQMKISQTDKMNITIDIFLNEPLRPTIEIKYSAMRIESNNTSYTLLDGEQ